MQIAVKKQGNLLLCFFCGLLATSTIFVIITLYQFISLRQTINQNFEHAAQKKLDDATQQLSTLFQEVTLVAHTLEQQISTNNYTKKSLKNLLKKTLIDNPRIASIGAAFQPYQFDANKRLFAPYWIRNKTIEYKPIHSEYDYTLTSKQAQANTDWYSQTLQKGSFWADPFFGSAINDNVIVYAVTVYNKKDIKRQKPIGMVYVDYKLDRLRHLVNSIDLGNFGYGFVISQHGKFASHPVESYYKEEKTILDLAKEFQSTELERLNHIITTAKSGHTHYKIFNTGQDSTIFYKIIPPTNLILGLLFIKEETLAQHVDNFRKKSLFILFYLLILLLSLCALIFRIDKMDAWRLGYFSVGTSLFLILGIICIWQLAKMYPLEKKQNQIILLNHSSIKKALLPFKTNSKLIKIKCGIFLQNLYYSAIDKIYASGYIWFKYPIKHTRPIQDFIFPNAVEQIHRTLLVQDKTDNHNIKIWWFTGLFQQQNNVTKTYPIDTTHIKIMIDYPEINNSIFFTPDLDAYEKINPTAFPGITPNLQIPQWFLKKSFFSYEAVNQQQTPRKNTLSYNITLQRNFSRPLATYLLPLILALLLLFMCSFFISRLNYTFHVIISFIIFTYIVFAQASIKNVPVCYLEYCYLVTCIIIILNLINTPLRKQQKTPKLTSLNPNMLAKILLCPTYFVIIFIITAYMFY